MLVLSRRIEESIVIAGDIRVTIISIQGDKVRLGILAPPSVRVDREEVAARRAGADGGSGGSVTIDADAAAQPGGDSYAGTRVHSENGSGNEAVP